MNVVREQHRNVGDPFPSDWPVTRMVGILRAQLPHLATRYGIQSLGVFGSYRRNQQGQDSDLDLLVEFDDRGLTLLQVIELEDYLSDLLRVKVDLVEKSCLKPTIGRRILSEVVAIGAMNAIITSIVKIFSTRLRKPSVLWQIWTMRVLPMMTRLYSP